MRAMTCRMRLLGRNRPVVRAVALAAGAGCIVVMAVSGGAVASASTASAAGATGRTAAAARTGASAAANVPGVPDTSWPAYLGGPLHGSYAPLQTAITPANATTLVHEWAHHIGAPYQASPIVNRGSVYVGGGNGWFYRLSEQTGKVLAKVFIGFQPKTTCWPQGVTSTATIAQNPSTHVLTVYVAGADGYLYALRALTLTREWRAVIGIPSKKVNDYYNWSSPTVANGKIYMGVASSCDKPLVRGDVLAFDQASGAKLAGFHTTPPGTIGGTVWSSIAVAPSGYVFVTTGNGPRHRPLLGDSESILKLNPNTLALVGRYQLPSAEIVGDGDFGASPVVFGRFVGACDKNGWFYALRQRNMTLAWRQQIGQVAGSGSVGECLAAPVYNGQDLYFGGNEIPGTLTPGSVQERSPSTGALIWETPLPSGVQGSPTMDGAGVIAVGTDTTAQDGVYLINAATGAIIERLAAGSTFAQSVFAEDRIFTATSYGVSAWGLPGT
jgi:outer membrane protein assembly factor BamB